MSKVLLLCFVITYFSILVANGELTCYSCVMNGGETDRACEKNPAAVITSPPTVKCLAKFCQIRRLEYLDHPGQIFTFFRGCTNDSYSGVTEGGGFKEYVRVCTTDLCNDWDGISSGPSGRSGGGSGGSGGGSGGSERSVNGYVNFPWLVDGIGLSGAGNQRVDLFVAIINFSVVMYLYR